MILFFGFSMILMGQSKLLRKADRFYKNNHFSEAIPLYKKALEQKNTASIKLKLASAYQKLNRLEQAVKIYAEVVQSGKARPRTYYDYGVALMGVGQYDVAKGMFERYVESMPKDEKGLQMLKACTHVKNIEPLYPEVMLELFARNSTSDDYGPIFFQDGISFSSDRPRGIRLFKEKSGMTGREYLNLYYSQKNEDGGYSNAKPFSNKINALNKNAGPASFSADGTTIVFTRNGHEMSKKNTFNMQLYEAKWVKGKWKNVKKVDFCSKEFNYMHPAFSVEGDELYFVSDKRGSMGGTDIFVAKKQADGKWGTPKNLGSAVNTPQNEGFPFVDSYGQLYFCSKGHFGFGGFDIFTTHKEANSWVKPRNLGQPINSSQDDIGFAISGNGKTGAFSSARGGLDDDIYLFEIKRSTKTAYREEKPSTTLTASQDPMIGIEEESYNTNEMASAKRSKKRSLALFSDQSNRPTITAFNDLAVKMRIDGMGIGKEFKMDVYFENNDHIITHEMEAELNKLVEVLEENETLQVEIGTHTPSLGEAEDNRVLSQLRAEAVLKYVQDKGIALERLSAKGYGERHIVNHCTNGIVCPPSEHALNQRLMFKITGL